MNKIMPNEPTAEMWDRAWNGIKVNDELSRVRKVLSIHEIRTMFHHFCKAMFAAAPEVSGAPVLWQFR